MDLCSVSSLLILLPFFDVVCPYNYYMDPGDVIQEKVLNFGYSLILQDNRLLVGSPKTGVSNKLRDFNGSVFACENYSNCKSLVGFGQKNNLLGLSIDAGISRTSNAIICEPRFHEADNENQFPVGRCFIYKNNAVSEIINPVKSIGNVKKDDNGFNSYYAGMSESGFSVKRIKDQLSILGAPGFDTWKGCLLEYSKQNVQTFQVGSNMNDYAGYDVGFVRLNNASVVWYVVGAPRAKNLLGEVIIVESPEYFNSKKVVDSLQGQQFGEYFGSSLCTADLNGDGFDDILIGSPTYRSNKYNEGKVTVYFSNNNNGMFSINLQERIFGHSEGGMFGRTIANIGKLLADDTMDSVAVSAPYENNGKGTVYIYRRVGRNLKLHQTIFPLEKNALGFGISITNSWDIDSNQFNDFAVAAYQSSQIYIVKARPIIKLILSNIKNSIDKILIGKTESFFIEFCLSFQSKSTAIKLLPGVNIDISEEFQKVVIDKPKEVLDIFSQCFKRNIKTRIFSVDDTKPVEIKISAWMPYRDTNCSTCPIEDPDFKASETIIIPISPDCGSDDKCTPEYEINFYDEAFLVGTTSTLPFELDVRNIGEPAYVCNLIVDLPEDVSIERTDCQRMFASGKHSLQCSLGNPLKTNSMEKVKFYLDVSNLDISKKELCLKSVVRSYDNLGNVEKYLCVPLEYKRELIIKGISVPAIITYDTANEGFNNLTHEFLITNIGPSSYKDFSITFFVPYFPDKIKFNDMEEHILDIYNPTVFVDNVPKPHICSIVNDYRTLSSQLQPTKNPPRAERSVDDILTEQYSTSNKDVLENISLTNTIILGDTNVIEILCSVDRLQGYMVLKIPIRFSMPRMKILFEHELETKTMIAWGTNASIAVDQKQFEGIAITILDYSTSGLKTWQYVLIITFATIIGIATLVAIVYALYKVGFFSRPLKERMDTMELKLVDVDKTEMTIDDMENVDISGSSNNVPVEDEDIQKTSVT